jgi:predicted DNA-binding mobile mystery protein A
MKLNRARARRTLETRVAGLGQRLGALPPGGWVRAMRGALGMSSYQLASRMGFSPSRVRQFEAEEVAGSIRLSTLRLAAEAMHCRLIYALEPTEPLDDIVLRQAYAKAARQLSIESPDDLLAGESDVAHDSRIDELEELTMHFVDRRDLWS